MRAIYAKNRLINRKEAGKKVAIEEVHKKIYVEILEERYIGEGKARNIERREGGVEIYLREFILRYNNKIYEIAASLENTPVGEYIVLEKWENPYWKKNGWIYLPPTIIGEYLIILADMEGNKINASIHSWPRYPDQREEFKQGDFSSGCIRLKNRDMKELFYIIPLGEVVRIKYDSPGCKRGLARSEPSSHPSKGDKTNMT